MTLVVLKLCYKTLLDNLPKEYNGPVQLVFKATVNGRRRNKYLRDRQCTREPRVAITVWMDAPFSVFKFIDQWLPTCGARTIGVRWGLPGGMSALLGTCANFFSSQKC